VDPGEGYCGGGYADFGGNRLQGVGDDIVGFGPLTDPGATTRVD
jgi:hypothetical protein